MPFGLSMTRPPSSSTLSKVTQGFSDFAPTFFATASVMMNAGAPVSMMKLNGPLPLIFTRTITCWVSVSR